MRTVFLTAAIAVAALLLPSPARAQLTIGQGFKPSVAIDAATGTAYIVWYGTELDSSVRFCRLPRGASVCQGAGVVTAGSPATGTSLSRPFVVVSGSIVRVVQYRYGFNTGNFGRVVMWSSANGGDSWDDGVSIGSAAPGAFDEATFGPGATLSAVSDNSGNFQNLPLAVGAGAPPPWDLFPGRPYSGGVATTPTGGLVAVSAAGDGDTAFRTYSGSGNINDPASWTAQVSIGYTEYPRLAGAFNGPYLLAGDVNVMYVRRWNGIGFDAPVPIGPGDSSESHLYVDAGGRLHAVWPRLDAQGYHLQHSVSDDGVSWSSGSVLVQTSEQESYLRVAAAADHVGVAVWSARFAGVDQVRVAAIGPGAPGTAQPPPPPLAPPPVPPVTPSPAPEFGKTVVIRPISGKVRVRLPRSSRFVDLTSLDDVPLGATIDVKRGVIELASRLRTGAVETIRLDGGWFRVGQTSSSTDFTLNEPLAPCNRGTGRAAAAAAKPKTRKLWGDGKGKFRTRGKYSAATIRGTRWLVQDSCAGTLTRVTQGSVLVRAGKKRIVVRAGKRYLARPRR